MVRDFIIATYENRDRAYEAARDGAIVEKDMLGIVTQADSKGLASPWGPSAASLPASRAPAGPQATARTRPLMKEDFVEHPA